VEGVAVALTIVPLGTPPVEAIVMAFAWQATSLDLLVAFPLLATTTCY
jgi:hypothetical protein